MGFRVSGFGSRVWGLGFRCLGFRGLGFRDLGLIGIVGFRCEVSQALHHLIEAHLLPPSTEEACSMGAEYLFRVKGYTLLPL